MILSLSLVNFRVSRFHVSHLTHETFKLCLQNTLNMSKTARVYFAVRGAGEETLNVRSRSMTPRTMWRFSCHVLKFVPFSIGIELMLTVMLEAELVAESENNKQAKQTHIRCKTEK